MALEPCGECGHEISTKAASCPHCGAPNRTLKQPPGTAGTSTVAKGVFTGVAGCVVVPIALAVLLMLIALALASCAGGVPQEQPRDDRLRDGWGIFLGCVRAAQDGPLSAERLAMLTDVRQQTADASIRAIERAKTDPGFATVLPVLTEGIMRELFLAEVATGALDSYSKQAAALLMVKEELESLGLVDSIPGRCPDHLITDGQ